MAQLAAMAAYFFQAAVALGLVLAVSRILPPEHFTVYSFFIAITQLGAIAGFEWLRSACSRFYPGATAASEAEEGRALRFGGLASALLTTAAGAAAFAAGLPATLALLGTCVTIMQGASDLHLAMLRFRLQFQAFSWLQSLRSVVTAGATLAGAILGQSAEAAALGLVCGYLAYVVAAMIVSRGFGSLAPMPRLALVRKHLVYGGVSTGASIATLLAPIGLKTLLTSVLGASGAAGALLAIDLVQRPAMMVVQAVQGACYPQIVHLYDRVPGSQNLSVRLGHYYGLQTGLTLMTAAGLLAVLGPATLFLVSPALQPGFLRAAPYIVAIAAIRALSQTMLPTPAHLSRRLSTIGFLAVADCLLLNAAAAAAMLIFGSSDAVLLAGAAAGAGLAALPGLFLLKTLPFRLPYAPLLLAATGLAAAALLAGSRAPTPLQSAVAILSVALFSAPALFLLLRGLREARIGEPATPL
ncbi:hypothetical protein ASG72_14715 [Bosea sp. Leaf344]|uniref:hypothetical protein n=1 Tax=Bosea sp. Leaf344 TaxID=1736346 RepID=UPI000715854B|nr:hypothetical protein [Bosea sp. Leaf344]KQU51045.1 hypothetical protein ASG72_14715 [Bosea sp. Leaf344]